MNKLVIEGKELEMLQALVARFNHTLDANAAANDAREAKENAETRQAFDETWRAFEEAQRELAHHIAVKVTRQPAR